LGVSGLVDPDSAPRVGRLLGAEWLVGGELREKDKFPIHIASNLLDVPSPQVLGQPTADGLLEEFFRMEKELLFKIIEILKVELTEEERERLNKPFTTDIKALIDIARALQASDRGNYEQAERYYERALLRDPDISPVRTYIKELQTLGKVGPAGTKTRQMLQTIRNETSLTDQKTTTEVTRREDSPKDTSVPITIQVPVPSLGP
jgi:tetratricopeptide (TPR) repeat protein